MSDAARNRTNAAWLRAQLDDLASYVVLCAVPLTPDQYRRALLAISSGYSWRTWLVERAAQRAQQGARR